MLGNADDFDDREHGLPDGRIEDCELTDLNRWALRGGVRSDVAGLDQSRQRPFAAPAHQEPVRQRRSITAAIAWPKPMHMQATP